MANWIQRTVNKKDFQEGSLTRLADKAGESPMSFAHEHYHDSGKIGQKARFAVNANKGKGRRYYGES